MARRFLEKRNQELLRELQTLTNLVEKARIPRELGPYRKQFLQRCERLRAAINLNLLHLQLRQDSITNDLISKTQQATRSVRLLSSMGAIPILRASPADRICLNTIQWLHQNHTDAKTYPPAFINGIVGIRPFIDFVPIYSFPSLEQRGLLCQPLLFHEFGHLLYALHKEEMDELVKELMLEVDDALVPLSQRNDRFTDAISTQRQTIVDTWYSWAQELYCDAVGFSLGGPCYLHAFSNYLGMRDQGGYYRKREDLEKSTHPVTWLRIRFLARRVKAAGFAKLASSVESEWEATARLMGISEDYHGYYDTSLDQAIQQTLEDMLVETEPLRFSSSDVAGGAWSPQTDSPVRLFNWAWQIYQKNSDDYLEWESKQIEKWLDSGTLRLRN